MKIRFTNRFGTETGIVTIEGDQITASTEGLEELVAEFLEAPTPEGEPGRTAADFVAAFSAWDNGYGGSELIEE